MMIRCFLLILIAFWSCEPRVTFEIPQPEGRRDEKSIPEKLIGSYKSLQDSSRIVITTESIISIINSEDAGLISELDSIDRVGIKGDTSYAKINSNLRMDITIKGDSAFVKFELKDTMFNLHSNDVLRRFKGYYFLNEQISDDRWHVTKLAHTREGLVMGSISNKEDIEKLRELTSTKSDTTYEFRPTKRELNQFLRDDGFQDEVRYVKIE